MRCLPALILAGIIAAGPASPCTCDRPTVCERAEQAPVIFVGRLLEGGYQGTGENLPAGLVGKARFEVEESFRGLPNDIKEVEVHLSFVPAICSRAPYVNGRTYLVYPSIGTDGNLRDGACTLSRAVEFARDELRYLRSYFAGSTTGTIRGRIAADKDSSSVDFALDFGYSKPVAGVRVVARQGGKQWEAESDADGKYEITGLGAGEYSISAHHDHYLSGHFADPVIVSDRGCAISNIGMRSTNSVEGSVFDSQGVPVDSITVTLLSADPKMAKAHHSERTDGSGRFRFKRVTPGVYVLAVNPDGIRSSSPYPPSFYGNAAKPGLAAKLDIGPQTRLSGLNLVLGKKHSNRRIVVQMSWPDGSPVTNATIHCDPLGGDDSVRGELGSADKNGEASCLVFAEQPYRVRLTRLGQNGDPELREAIFSPGQDLARVHFVPGQLDFERQKAANSPGR